MRIYEKQYTDITGNRYNNLVAIRYVKTKNSRAWWEFRCDCGKIKEIEAKRVRTNNTKSCGCKKLSHNPKDLIGKRFGYLVVSEHIGQRKHQHWWKCNCDCGNTIEAKSALLSAGRIKSCGCLVTEVTTRMNKLRRGPNHPSWRSDISDEERRHRKNERKCSNPKLNRWRKKVYERDKYTCQKCGDNKGGNLIAHHIYSWAYYTTMRFIVDNGITFCNHCHKNFHCLFGKRRNTKKQLNLFLKSN